MKKFILLLQITLFVNSAVAQLTSEVRKVDGKDFKVYKVEKGDTWYAIARKFEISYSELRVANKDTDDKIIPGKELLIPGKLKANDPYFQKNQLDTKPQAAQAKPQTTTKDKFHVVQPSQTLYSISKMHGMTVEELKKLNNLTSNEISVGQKLNLSGDTKKKEPVKEAEKSEKVIQQDNSVTVISKKEYEETVAKESEKKSEPKTPVQVQPENKSEPNEENTTITKTETAPDTSQLTSDVENVILPPSETKMETNPVPSSTDNSDGVIFSNGRQQVNETGTAMAMNEESTTEKYFAYHRTAKVGTVIRVLNLSNSRKIYVRVTGQLPDDSENEGVLIKISKATAEKLGFTDKTARVNLMYGTNEE
jgi:LysM repeat protein